MLVVEDQDDARELIAFALSAEGANVRTAASADEALEALADFDPTLLVSDIAMPDRDGYWFVREVRKARPELPAIALTALPRPEDAERARLAGFDRHLAKPVATDQLLDEVVSLVRTPPARAR